jgi:hypothetical protein
MMRPRGLPALAGAVILTLLAGSAHADLAKCQKGLEKNGDKLRGAIWKALAKCKDGYQSAIAKAEALNVKAGPSCQLGLDKVLNAGNPVSTMAKTKAALDKLTALNLCTDQDLLVLGYLPPSVFGDHWARWLMIASLKAAYESQISFVGLTANIFQALNQNGCAICADLGRPPCLRASCPLLAGDGAAPLAASEAEAKVVDTTLTQYVPISGELITEGCQWPGVTNNELATVGGPGNALNPSSVLGNTACSLTIRSQGFTNCGAGGIANANVSVCQDSDLSDGNQCTTGLCLSDPDANTGGTCFNFTTAAGTPGNSVAMSTTQIRIVSPGQVGPDGVACTADDTAPPTPPNTIVVTTGSAQATLMDAGDVPGPNATSGPFSGAAGPNCTQLASGNLTGLVLVGAFPGADTVGSPLGDSITATRLQCQ